MDVLLAVGVTALIFAPFGIWLLWRIRKRRPGTEVNWPS